jgi:5-(carboxyamino)imidazole ribonucleotide mutase
MVRAPAQRSSRGERGADVTSPTSSPERALAPEGPPVVGVVMGSKSPTGRPCGTPPRRSPLDVPHEVRVVSAHRTPDLLFEYARGGRGARARGHHRRRGRRGAPAGHDRRDDGRAGAGRAVQSKALNGLDSLLSIVQMPAGVPVGTLAIGRAGATQRRAAGRQILALHDRTLRARLNA